jgi:transcriptional regulator
MYQPTHFREDRLDVQHALIRAHPLALLISGGDGGLVANPIPFLLDSAAGPHGTLRCHVAKANDQWQHLQTAAECLVVFQGADDYITPSWYASKKEHGRVVPTWNYATVHCWGRPIVTHDQGWLRAQLDGLTALQEGRRSKPWAVDDAPAEFVAAQIRGIVGIEIAVTRIEGKWKVSQNRPEADRIGVIDGLSAERPGPGMAALVAERSWVRRP